MKKIEKYIIAIITLIAVGAIGAAVYFGVNKTNEVNDNKNNVETTNDKNFIVDDIKNVVVTVPVLEVVDDPEMNTVTIEDIKGINDILFELNNSKRVGVVPNEIGFEFAVNIQINYNNNLAKKIVFLDNNNIAVETAGSKEIIEYEISNKYLANELIVLNQPYITNNYPLETFSLNDNQYYYYTHSVCCGADTAYLLNTIYDKNLKPLTTEFDQYHFIVNSNNTLTINDEHNFYVYDEYGKKIFESATFEEVIKVVEDYVIAIDNNYVNIYDLEGRKVVNFFELLDSYDSISSHPAATSRLIHEDIDAIYVTVYDDSLSEICNEEYDEKCDAWLFRYDVKTKQVSKEKIVGVY